jgi:hypothetical protein
VSTAGRARRSPRRDPLRLAVSGRLWRSAGFLAAYVFVTGWLLFAAGFTAVVVALVTAVFIFGIPLLAAAAGVLRGCANVERARVGQVTGEPVRGQYRPVTGRGLLARARTRWNDPATWRDLTLVVALWGPLFALDLAVLTTWLSLLGLIFLPAWYRFPTSTFAHGHVVHGVQLGYFPNGPDSVRHWGLYVTTLHQAWIPAALALVLFLLFNYVVVGTARLHAAMARGLLRAPADPLADARAVLARPGPIPPQGLVSDRDR